MLSKQYTEIHIGSWEQIGIYLSKHGIVLDEGFSQRRAVVGDEDELSLSVSGGLKGGLGSQSDFAGSHDEGQLGVDVFLSGFLDHFWIFITFN